MNRTLSFAAVAALLAAVLVAPAAAQEEGLAVSRLVLLAPTTQVGDGALFKAFEPASGTTAPDLTVRAVRATVETWEGSGTFLGGVPVSGEEIGQEVANGYPVRTEHVFQNLDLHTVAVPSAFDLEVQGRDHSRMRIHGTFDTGEVVALDDAYMTSEGIREPQPGDEPSQVEWTFSRKHAEGAHLLTTTSQGANATLRGDLLLEFRGFVLGGTARGGPVELRGDYETGPVHPDAPNETSLAARSYTYRFVRMQLENAAVEFRLPDAGDHLVQWASQTLLSTTGGRAVADVGDQRIVLPAGTMELGSDGEAVVVGFPAEAQGGVFMSAALRKGLITIGLVAGSGMVVAAAVVAVVRLRTPSLRRVEAALEAGEYARAARLADRLVRRRPSLEGARISHAIALTKNGRAAEVVDQLEAYLALHVPSDGVMHYVLGSAYLVLGNEDAARRAFREAGARTPALLQEIEPRLRGPVRRDNDAQAYA